MDLITLLVLCMLTLTFLSQVPAVPTDEFATAIKRTVSETQHQSSILKFNIDPDIEAKPGCRGSRFSWPVNINIKSAPSRSSGACKIIRDRIERDEDQGEDVDFFLTCPKQGPPEVNSPWSSHFWQFLVTMNRDVNMSQPGEQKIPATLAVHKRTGDILTKAEIEIGCAVNLKQTKVQYRFIYCLGDADSENVIEVGKREVDDGLLKLDIDPEIETEPGCHSSDTWAPWIHVKSTGDESMLSHSCSLIREVIKNEHAIDLVLGCPDQSPSNVAKHNVFFNIVLDPPVEVNMSDSHEQKFPGTLYVYTRETGPLLFAKSDVYLGGWAEKEKNKIEYRVIYCLDGNLKIPPSVKRDEPPLIHAFKSVDVAEQDKASLKLDAGSEIARRDYGDQETLKFNIDPDITTTTSCGTVYTANINVKFAPDFYFTTSACNDIRNHIGGDFGNLDVDVIFLCPSGEQVNLGSHSTKFMISLDYSNPVIMNESGQQRIPATLGVYAQKKGQFVTTKVSLAGWVNKKKGTITYKFIYCK